MEFKGIPRCQGSYDLSECHCLRDLGRHKEPPLSHLDHEIACMTSVAGEAAWSTQNIFQTLYVCSNHRDNSIHSDHSYLYNLEKP